MTTARAVLFAGGDQLLDDLGHGSAADDRTEVLRVLGGHGGERFGARQFACPEVVFHRGDEREPGFVREVAGGDEGVAFVGFQIGEVLHASLNLPRHDQGFLLRGLDGAEHLTHAFAVAVPRNGEAGARAGNDPVDGD